jgi:hypothetical protein
MAVLQPCACGAVYNLKSEYAGKLLECPRCHGELRPPLLDRVSGADILKVFGTDKFLLRQNHFSISTKYTVRDEDNKDILFVQRPSRYSTRMGMAALSVLLIAVLLALFPFWGLAVIPLVAVCYIIINVRRDITFYDSPEKWETLLEIRQEDWLQPKWIRYILYDHKGAKLGYFEKNRFTDFLRRRWRFLTPDGTTVITAQEDSLIASLLRRVTGYFFDFAIFRTNFVFFAGSSEQVVGEFNKKISLLDRYTLDLSIDTDKLIDPRAALALGVLLDTGEGR